MGDGLGGSGADQRDIFLVDRKGMEEIGKGLGVHQPMLKRNREHLLRYLVRDIIDGLPDAEIVLLNLCDLRANPSACPVAFALASDQSRTQRVGRIPDGMTEPLPLGSMRFQSKASR